MWICCYLQHFGASEKKVNFLCADLLGFLLSVGPLCFFVSFLSADLLLFTALWDPGVKFCYYLQHFLLSGNNGPRLKKHLNIF